MIGYYLEVSSRPHVVTVSVVTKTIIQIDIPDLSDGTKNPTPIFNDRFECKRLKPRSDF